MTLLLLFNSNSTPVPLSEPRVIFHARPRAYAYDARARQFTYKARERVYVYAARPMSIEDNKPPVHWKKPIERYPIAIDFTDQLPSAASVSSATVAAVDMADANASVSGILPSSSCTVTSNVAKFDVAGGTRGKRYLLTVTAVLSTGTNNKLTDDVMLVII